MLELIDVSKRFGNVDAVQELNLTVAEGAVCGLIGPNGAGKTTTMRMIVNILAPDEGAVAWRGRPVGQVAPREFGYLPEERGLYPRMPVRDVLRFFAALRGVRGPAFERDLKAWLDRFLGEHQNKKVEDLSRGNGQKAQFLAAILHRPRLLILDEPFSGLDPLNVRLLKEAVREIAAQGTTILFSSHRMDHVEELCTDVCLIHRGTVHLRGPLPEVRRASGRRILRLAMADPAALAAAAARVPLLAAGRRLHDEVVVELHPAADTRAILQGVLAAGEVARFEVAPPTLEQLYVEIVGKGKDGP